jgi:hypothetical protein
MSAIAAPVQRKRLANRESAFASKKNHKLRRMIAFAKA